MRSRNGTRTEPLQTKVNRCRQVIRSEIHPVPVSGVGAETKHLNRYRPLIRPMLVEGVKEAGRG